MSLRAVAARGFGIIVALKLMTSTLGRASALILPFFLRPEDFGLFGIASFFVGLGMLFNEFGLGTALVRQRRRVAEALAVGFTLRLLLSVILTLVLVSLTVPISILYNDPRLQLLIAILAVSLILNTANFLPRVLAVRRLDFKRAAVPDHIAKATGAIATIGFAAMGMRYWSPAFGVLSGLVAGAVVFFFMVPWRPKLDFDKPLAAELLTFGSFVTAANLSSVMAHGADNAIVGALMGMAPLGFYLLAYTWAVQIPSNISATFASVSYPVFSRLADDLDRLRRSYSESVRFYALFVTFMAVGVFALAHPFVATVYGPTWMPAIEPMQILALSGFFIGLAGIGFGVLQAADRPRAVFAASVVEAALVVVAIPPAVLFAGLAGAALVSAAGAVVLCALVQRHVRRHTGVHWRSIVPHFANPIIASLSATIPVLMIQALWGVSLSSFIVSVVAYPLAYLVAMTGLTGGRFITELKALGGLALRRAPEAPKGEEEGLEHGRGGAEEP